MSRSQLDHLVITAPTLDAGSEFVRAALGADLAPGGEHARMGTHNRLLRLGDSLYLEVIAPDPVAPAPGRPRWFALDSLAAGSPPRLAAWVARTPDIRAAAAASSEPLGAIEAMSRGALEWLITIPADGELVLGGAAPALIEWRADPHPSSRLPERGLALAKLECFHPEPARVVRLLASLGVAGALEVSAAPEGEAPRLVAHIDTPQGRRILSAPA